MTSTDSRLWKSENADFCPVCNGTGAQTTNCPACGGTGALTVKEEAPTMNCKRCGLPLDLLSGDIDRHPIGSCVVQLSGALYQARAELARLKRHYGLFEAIAPPDWPRAEFVKACFDAWENSDEQNHRIATLAGEAERLVAENGRLKTLAHTATHNASVAQYEIGRLRAALFAVIDRAVLEEATTWRDTANEMATIAHDALEHLPGQAT